MVLPSPPCFPPPSTSVTLCVSSRSSAAGWKEVEVGGWVVEASRVEEREAARTTSGGSRGEGGWWGAAGRRRREGGSGGGRASAWWEGCGEQRRGAVHRPSAWHSSSSLC